MLTKVRSTVAAGPASAERPAELDRAGTKKEDGGLEVTAAVRGPATAVTILKGGLASLARFNLASARHCRTQNFCWGSLETNAVPQCAHSLAMLVCLLSLCETNPH